MFAHIAAELNGFIAWLWNKAAPPKRKSWCAAFYFVAQEDASLDYPENTLDQKMADTVAAVVAAAAAVQDYVHVVYRTVPSDPITSDPVAQVVKLLGPRTGTIFFPDCYDPGSTLALLDTEKDLTCFLKWVYRWCPADHYAIFIWGHSFGPAGLFEPGSGLEIPKPGLAALQEAFKQFRATRIAGDARSAFRKTSIPKPGDRSRVTGTSAGAQAIEAWAKGDKKVEVALFLDCWMSTLETAFEISDSTARTIASQSLLPVGRHYANFVWPYEDLLKALLLPSFAKDMTNRLVKFYVDHFNQVQYLSTIPVTLLDLSHVPALSPLMAALVSKLASLLPPERKVLIEPARIVKLDLTDPYDPIILAGDGALIDIPTLCATLQSTVWPLGGTPQEQQAAKAAAAAVDSELSKLVELNQEAHSATASDVGFRGVSAFHWPPVEVTTDDYITEAVRRSPSAYTSLEFVKQTTWQQLGLEHKPI